MTAPGLAGSGSPGRDEGAPQPRIRVGNAPCSWGALEFPGLPAAPPSWAQVLDEMRDTGYEGTELGDWGFLPTDPSVLRAELARRGLALIGAFVPVALKDSAAHADGEAHALRVARLLAAACPPDHERGPLLVLSDANATDPLRTRHAGRIKPEHGLSPAEWETFARGAERIARAVREATGLRTAFHHHCAGYVEHPEEIARFLELTDPELVGLTFDTGHFAYGLGRIERGAVERGLERFGRRVWHVHLKDCDPQVAEQARREGWDYFTALRRGLFCELGQGCVDFGAVIAWLRAHQYGGWVVVEQDVLPGQGSPRASAARNRAFLASLGL